MNTKLVLELEKKVRDGFYDKSFSDGVDILTQMLDGHKLEIQFRSDLFTAFNLSYEDREAILIYKMAPVIYDTYIEFISIGIREYVFLFFRKHYEFFLFNRGTPYDDLQPIL